MVLRKAIIEGRPRIHKPWTKIMIIAEGVYRYIMSDYISLESEHVYIIILIFHSKSSLSCILLCFHSQYGGFSCKLAKDH